MLEKQWRHKCTPEEFAIKGTQSRLESLQKAIQRSPLDSADAKKLGKHYQSRSVDNKYHVYHPKKGDVQAKLFGLVKALYRNDRRNDALERPSPEQMQIMQKFISKNLAQQIDRLSSETKQPHCYGR